MLRNLKDIPGYEGLYAITKYGRIWSHRLGREIFTFVDKSKVKYYLRIALTDSEGKVRKFYHHRLVALTYIPKHKSKIVLEINHKDYNTLNNRVENLEWVTRSQNILYSVHRRKNLKKNKV